MAIRNVYLDEKLHERWNDDTSTLTRYNADGVTPSTGYPRAYTAAERATIDSMLLSQSQAANKAQIKTNLNQDLIDMQTIIDTPNNSVLTAANLKAVARAIRRLDRMALEKFDGVS